MIVLSILASLFFSLSSYLKKKKSLDLSGAIAAFFVGVLTFKSGFYFTIILLFFFFSSSKLTKYKADIKKQREEDYHENQGRNWKQVLANGGFPTLLCYFYLSNNFSSPIVFGKNQLETFLLLSYLCAYCCNCGDTWSSELGILSSEEPFHVLTFKRVPHGTNGGISKIGTIASVVAGLIYGIIIYSYILIQKFFYNFSLENQYKIIFFTIFSSTFGSIIDSILGSIFEYSGYCNEKKMIVKVKSPTTIHISGMNLLDGNGVNFVSNIITGMLFGVLGIYFF